MKMTIYTEIDTLFDTRLPIVTEVHDVGKKSYINRTDDNFDFIGEDSFKILYSKRERFHLHKAKPTLMFEEIGNMANKMIKENEGVSIELILNIYPYELMPVEICNFMELLEETYPFCKITIADIKPTYEILSRYNVTVCYTGIELLEDAFRHGADILSSDTSLVVPALASRYANGLDIVNGFKATMKEFEPIINLVYYDAIYWSHYE